jgi:hypothetical protein
MRLCGLLLFGLTLAEIGAAQDSNFSAGPQYLMNYGSPMFMRSIATPTLSLSETAPVAVAAPEATSSPVSSAGNSAESSAAVPQPSDLASVYWGSRENEPPAESGAVIEVSGTTPPANLPASIFNVGVQETVDAQELRQRGYGVSVSEASVFWKGHKPRAVRVFTNRDVEKFHGE